MCLGFILFYLQKPGQRRYIKSLTYINHIDMKYVTDVTDLRTPPKLLDCYYGEEMEGNFFSCYPVNVFSDPNSHAANCALCACVMTKCCIIMLVNIQSDVNCNKIV